MANNQIQLSDFRPNTRLLTAGAVTTAVGALVAAAGATLVVSALASAGRSWVRTWETAPSVLATRTLRQAQSAAQAAQDAWRQPA